MSDNNQGLATAPIKTLEDMHAILTDTSIPADMAIATVVVELERILGIEQTIDFNDDLMSATALAEDKKRGFGL